MLICNFPRIIHIQISRKKCSRKVRCKFRPCTVIASISKSLNRSVTNQSQIQFDKTETTDQTRITLSPDTAAPRTKIKAIRDVLCHLHLHSGLLTNMINLVISETRLCILQLLKLNFQLVTETATAK